MNGTNVTHGELHEERKERSLKTVVGGGSMVEAIGGIAAIVLAIIGLAGGLQTDMATIATIVLGASLILEGGAIATSYRQALFNLEGQGVGSSDFGGASTVEFLAGFTGIVLGILALLGVGTMISISVSVIVFGSALLLSSSAVAHLNSFWSSGFYTHDESREVARVAADAGTGGQVLVGLSAIVLGILALLGINSMTLTLVALLALGATITASTNLDEHGAVVRYLLHGIYWVLPSTNLLSETRFLEITKASLKPTGWLEHGITVAYGLDYAIVFLLVAMWSFHYRSLKRD